MEGLVTTLSVVATTFIFGALAAVAVLWWLKHSRRIQSIALPFFDELTLAAAGVGKELRHPARRPLSLPRAVHQGLVLCALALVTGATIHGVLLLIGSLATPAG